MLSIRFTTLAAVLFLAVAACGSAGAAPLDLTQRIEIRLDGLEHGTGTIAGQKLWNPRPVARFYRARQMRAAWSGRDAEDIVQAIRGMSRDGLNPASYHLAAIERLLSARRAGTNPTLEGDLDILLSDAVAAMIDHVRYGRVRASTLNAAWNVDPREGAPALHERLATVRAARDLPGAIEAQRPNHFIYRGLVRELEALQNVQERGGWARITPGPAITPGSRSERIPAIRRRLEATGEFRGSPGSDPTFYDRRLVEAVRRFQTQHRLPPDGVIGSGTVGAMNVGVAARMDQVRVNLERARWVLNGLDDEFVLVNVPAFKAYMIRGNRRVWEARTQVGADYMKTPTFRAMMTTVVFNPDWVVPTSIAKYEVLDPMANGDNVLMKMGLRVFDKSGREIHPASVNWNTPAERFPYTLRQLPGNRNPLGRVKFLFPNKYSIYLHDTPNKHLFAARDRQFSHGCIRVENALQLAKLVLDGQDYGGVQTLLADGQTKSIALERPIPVLIVYWTVSVGASGNVSYAEDIYNFDRQLATALKARRA